MKTVLVTGASAGFGQAIARLLVEKGDRVIGTARRKDRLEALANELGDQFYPLEMDVTDFAGVDKALASLPESFSTIDVLVNNAGLALGLEKAHEADIKDWMTMIETNTMGLVYITRQILPAMVERQSGQVINIGSTAGNYPYMGGNVYGATKAFVKQFSLNLRADLAGTKVRVTNVEPGLCGGTEFSNIRFKGDDSRATQTYEGTNSIQPEDIANTILWLIEQPEHVNVNRIELMPTSQSFGGLTVTREE
ncbi:SDR family oxidoreductase [Streptococcus caprae]|uniref:SDR family oxidoreductase n=1 Tax=Streptococcus caprae TaxID=1640501 RepID=A0ABV8CYA2_9STRE